MRNAVSTASTLTRRAPLVALWRRIKLERAWYAMMALPVVYLVIFHYVPMAGIVLAFQDYKMGRGVFGSDWVGFKWFIQFFESFYFWRLMRNTLLLSFYSIVFGFPVPIIFALMLNEMKVLPLKRVVQTVSYLPHFISLVIIVGMLVTFLSPNNGIINIVIKSLGGEPINFLGLQSWFRPLYIGSGIWQHFGFSSIIYLAAIAGISQELYDAAEVDGASRIQRIRFVTVPGMAPTIIILLILNLGTGAVGRLGEGPAHVHAGHLRGCRRDRHLRLPARHHRQQVRLRLRRRAVRKRHQPGIPGGLQPAGAPLYGHVALVSSP